MKKVFILTIYIIFCNIIFAQTYYGKNNLGKLEFINDSIYVTSFYTFTEMRFYDTGTYYKVGDTLFLNSKVKLPFVLEEVSREERFETGSGNDINRIIKFFSKDKEMRGCYRMTKECAGYGIFYDSINKELKCPVPICNGEVIVVFECGIYRRIKANGNYKYYKIKIMDDKIDRIYLDNFPLLIKKNKLIPIDKNKNEDCWINNGFYFPTMVRRKDSLDKNVDRILVINRGIIGLYPGYDP